MNEEMKTPEQESQPVVASVVQLELALDGLDTKVVDPVEEAKKIIERYHCPNCRKDLYKDDVMKEPLDYRRNADGSVEPIPARYSVFCNTCQQFLCIIDPVAISQVNALAK